MEQTTEIIKELQKENGLLKKDFEFYTKSSNKNKELAKNFSKDIDEWAKKNKEL